MPHRQALQWLTVGDDISAVSSTQCDFVSRSGSCMPGWAGQLIWLVVLAPLAVVLVLVAVGKVRDWRAERRGAAGMSDPGAPMRD